MDLITQLPGVKQKELMSQHTTFAVGGPAEYFYAAKTTDDLVKAVTVARDLKIPFIVLGNGSNILVSDQGIKGLVIKNQTDNINVLQSTDQSSPSSKSKIKPRYQALDKTDDITNLEYDESKYESVMVELDSGIFLPKAIFSLINQGITGLEWFAGIPATVGGATYINLHGGNKYFSDYLISAKILDSNNQIKTVPAEYFDFKYDDSKLKDKADIVLSVTLRLLKGPQDKALNIAKAWALKKSHQPQKSAGCIFQNLSAAEQEKLNLPTPSIGYLMDKQLNLKATKINNAQISTQHAGFVENLGNAKAADIIALIGLMRKTAKQKLNLDLKLEIVPLGFDKEV